MVVMIWIRSMKKKEQTRTKQKRMNVGNKFLKYDYGYRHLQIMIDRLKIIVELSEDTMLNGKTFCAKSDLMFQDEQGDWGHAVGVGSNEQDALDMCLSEIRDYLKHDFTPVMQEIDLPKRFTYIYKKRTIVLQIEQSENNFSILTPYGRKNINTDNIVEYISKNQKEFKKDSVDDYSEELFKKYNFKKPFDTLTQKYNN